MASNGMLIVEVSPMFQTGTDIETNATNLNYDMTMYLDNLQSQCSSSAVPACIQNILRPYADARTTEMEKMVKRRRTIGDLLSKAANMHELNENMQKNGFANLYQNVNGFYGPNIDSANALNLYPNVGAQYGLTRDTTNPVNMQRGTATKS